MEAVNSADTLRNDFFLSFLWAFASPRSSCAFVASAVRKLIRLVNCLRVRLTWNKGPVRQMKCLPYAYLY